MNRRPSLLLRACFAAIALAAAARAQPPVITTIAPPNNVLAQFGYGLAVADLNHDGRADIVVGAREANAPGLAQAGRVYVYYGPSSAAPARIIDDPAPQLVSHFGVSTAVGDVNGDGEPDILVGARQADVNGISDAGKAVVFYGPDFVSWREIFPPSPEFRGQFGAWMACGDFDADGYCDVAVSSIGATAGTATTAGRVDVFFGPSLAPAFALPDPSPGIGDRFGYRLETGDLDGDGFDDLVVAAPFKTLIPLGSDDSGAVFGLSAPLLTNTTYLPNPHPSQNGLLGADLAVADINADGHLDIIAGSELDNSGGLTEQGSVYIFPGPLFPVPATPIYAPVPTISGGFGGGVAVGDFNGDGVKDLMVGEFTHSGWAPSGGQADILLGPAFTTAIVVHEPVPASGNQFGRRVRSGDFDGDGDDEMIVGVPFSSVSGTSRSGAVYIVRH